DPTGDTQGRVPPGTGPKPGQGAQRRPAHSPPMQPQGAYSARASDYGALSEGVGTCARTRVSGCTLGSRLPMRPAHCSLPVALRSPSTHWSAGSAVPGPSYETSGFWFGPRTRDRSFVPAARPTTPFRSTGLPGLLAAFAVKRDGWTLTQPLS